MIGVAAESGTTACDTLETSFDTAENTNFVFTVGGWTKSKKMVYSDLAQATDGCFVQPVAFYRFIRLNTSTVVSRYFDDNAIINPSTNPRYGKFIDVTSAKFAVRAKQNAAKPTPTPYFLLVLKYETNAGDWS